MAVAGFSQEASVQTGSSAEILLSFPAALEARDLIAMLREWGADWSRAIVAGNASLPGGWLDLQLLNANDGEARRCAAWLQARLGARLERERAGKGPVWELSAELEALELEGAVRAVEFSGRPSCSI